MADEREDQKDEKPKGESSWWEAVGDGLLGEIFGAIVEGIWQVFAAIVGALLD